MALLDVEGVTVNFGGLRALDDVDLDVAAGSVTGLIGPNGAGKTTMFNVICGFQTTSTGCVRLEGRDMAGVRPHQRTRLGVARTFQRLEVFGSLSVRENVLVAAEVHRQWDKTGDPPQEVADALIDRIGLRAVAKRRVDAMPTGIARLVELARALASQPKVLLLDEPSSGLDEHESDEFAALLPELAAEGLGILLVEHDVELVMKVCARIHVLDFGSILAVGTPAEIQRNKTVQAAYLGGGVDLDEVAAHSGNGNGKGKTRPKQRTSRR
ncbi:MAG: ABC transporter ATP-binding protein [Actinobacteria bacterium]|nr:ABC transporter ATP-binding protein [Actinomycetota bacterium]